MTGINPYLAFNGNCREAMTFYHSCLGGDLRIMTFADGPMDVAEADKSKVMHASIYNNGATLMGSDTVGGRPLQAGSSMSISVNCSSREEVDEVFNKMAEGGHITMPVQDTFWGARFGMLTDRYGMHWMFNCESKK
ncbi:VOC family protein [Chitinophagaceae bacterium MMS25-I14]